MMNLLKKIKGLGANLLASAIPAGRPVLDMVRDVLGADSSDEDVLLEAIARDPDAAVKLRELELRESESLREHQYAIRKLAFDDTKDARSREVEVTRITGERDKIQAALAVGTTAGFFALSAIIVLGFAKEGENLILVMFGALSTSFATVLNYYFGNSKKEGEKK